MKETITKFKCDECGKDHTTAGFPYNDGWIYLYNLNMQVKAYAQTPEHTVDRIEHKDTHFCSGECFISFIKKKLLHHHNDKKVVKK